ncbi:MAG: hypothetical protein QXY52_00650 [Conexivisphaerales archaeon]
MKRSTFLYVFGFIIIVVGIFLISSSTGNYGVSIVVFPIPFIFTFGKPATLVSTLTLIMGAVMLVLFLTYIAIIFYQKGKK